MLFMNTNDVNPVYQWVSKGSEKVETLMSKVPVDFGPL